MKRACVVLALTALAGCGQRTLKISEPAELRTEGKGSSAASNHVVVRVAGSEATKVQNRVDFFLKLSDCKSYNPGTTIGYLDKRLAGPNGSSILDFSLNYPHAEEALQNGVQCVFLQSQGTFEFTQFRSTLVRLKSAASLRSA